MGMAAIGDRVTVGDVATLIATDGRYVRVKNAGVNPVDLGGAAVASGAGYELAANEVCEVDCTVDELYGVCGAGLTSDVEVLAVRRPYSL